MVSPAGPEDPNRSAPASPAAWRLIPERAALADPVAVVLLCLGALAAVALSARDAAAYIRGDWPTAFFPTYAELGARLRAGDIPGWSPAQFAGAPFAGDPSSGWGNLAAMLLYSLLPAEPATSVFVGAHVLISALGAYALARTSGLGPAGGLAAGAAFGFPWLIPAASGQVLFFQVTAWMPWALVGVQLALRPDPMPRRFLGLVLSGFAISQILAAWLGQGAYYALVLIGGWVGWRTLATPPPGWGLRERLLGLFGCGGSILLLGCGLNALALVPRLEVNGRTNLAGGVYTGLSRWADTKLGQDPLEMMGSLAGGFGEANWAYRGAAVIALALLAPFVAPRWPPLGFWIIAGSVVVALALPWRTPVHAVAFALLPRFESIHFHVPDRVLMVITPVLAMLAAATVDALATRPPAGGWRRLAPLLAIALVAVSATILSRGGVVSVGAWAAALAALAVCAVAVVLPVAFRGWLVPLALVAVIGWDPAGRVVSAGWGDEIGPERSLRAAVGGDVESFLHANGAAGFIAEATQVEPGRYIGYDPTLLPIAEIAAGRLPRQGYREHWFGPANWLLVFNWATWFGLEDAQGYNPVQLRRYTEYVDALNGHPQEYHQRDLFPAALDSPLLAPLNLRFLIVPASATERPDLAPLLARMPEVYADERVRIVENPDAMPRTWLVHEARQVAPGEALPLLKSGVVDPRTTALLEAPPPELAVPTAPEVESVAVIDQSPDEVRLEVEAAAPALVMVSEAWDTGWTATVDGEPAPVLVADHVFQTVPVPAGPHSIVLGYDPPLLRLGIAVTAATVILIVVTYAALVRRERRGDAPGREAPRG